MCPLYLDSDRLRKNDQAASAATTQGLVDDIQQQWQRAQEPDPPTYALPDLGSLGVSTAPSVPSDSRGIMAAMGAIPQLGQRIRESVQPALSWALPDLESLGVSDPAPDPLPTPANPREPVLSPANPPAAVGTPAPMSTGAPGAAQAPVASGPPPSGDDPWGQKAYAAAVKAGHPNPREFAEQMRWESGGFAPDVIAGTRNSSAGARGIAQIMPATAVGWGVNPLDPDAALAAAAHHMTEYYRKYGDSERALAAYNMGEDNLEKYGPRGLAETNTYIDIIHERSGRSAPNAGAAQPTTPAPLPPASAGAPSAGAGPSGDMVTVRDPWGNTFRIKRADLATRPGGSADLTIVPDGPVAQASPLDAARATDQGGSGLAMRQPLGQPSDEPQDTATSDEAAIQSTQTLPSLGQPQRSDVTWDRDGAPWYPGVETQRMAGQDGYDPRDADQGPHEATPGSVGASSVRQYGPSEAEAGPPEEDGPFKPLYDAGGAVIGYVKHAAEQAGTTIANEGIAAPIARSILNPIRSAVGAAPLTAEDDSPLPFDRAVMETARSLPSNVEAAQAGYQQGDYGRAGLGALGILGDLAPSTTLARQLSEMLPKAETPWGEVGVGDVVMTAAMVHGLASLGYGAVKIGQRVGAPIIQALREGVPAERFAEWANAAADTIDTGIEAARGAGRRIGEGLAENAERTAAADSRMAAEGGTAAPGVFGQVPPERWAKPSEQALRSEVGQKYPDIRGRITGATEQTLGEPSAEMLRDSRYPRERVSDVPPSEIVARDDVPRAGSFSLNAGFGTVPEEPRRVSLTRRGTPPPMVTAESPAMAAVNEIKHANLVTPSRMVELIGDRPEYLADVAQHILDQRRKVITGEMTVRDTAKAYYMTLASQGADAIKVATVEAKVPGFKIPEQFYSAERAVDGSALVRPEEAAAAWLFTPKGQQALDDLERGVMNREAWKEGQAVRTAFGDDRFRTNNVFSERAPVNGRTQFNMDTIQQFTDRFNEIAQTGNPRALLDFSKRLNGISEAKGPFLNHALGFGETPTIDAVEISAWLTGQGNVSRLQGKAADLKRHIDVQLKDKRVGAALGERIGQQFDAMRELLPSEATADLPPEVFNHVLHHWIWDRMKGTATTHTGFYDALQNAATLGVTPASQPTDRLGAVNRALGQVVASTVSGGVGAQVNSEMDPDDPNAGLKGFAAGALVPALAARGVRAGLRAAGKGAEELRGGARIGLGDVPPSKVNQGMLPGMHPLRAQLRPLSETAREILGDAADRVTDVPAVRGTGGQTSMPTLEPHRGIAERIAEAVAPWANRVNIVRFAGMLSDTAGHAMNATGNTAMAGVDIATTPITAALDVGRSALTGKPREAFFSEVPARLRGMRAGASVGMQNAAEIMGQGTEPSMRLAGGKLEAVSGVPNEATKLDHPVRGFDSGNAAVDFAFEAPLRALAAADAVFRGVAKGGHLMAEATAAAQKANGGKAPTEAMVREAMKDPKLLERVDYLAARSVLQEDRMPTDWYKKAMRYRPENATGALATDAIKAGVAVEIPFVKTPYNIVAQGVGMSPAGLFGLAQDMAEGRSAREMEQRVARVALGTAVMVPAAMSYSSGNLTGPYPTDAKERSTLPPGWTPWSQKIPLPGGGTYYLPLSVFGPLALPAVMTILAGEAYKKHGLSPAWAGEVARGMAQYAAQNTFFQGVTTIAKTLDAQAGDKNLERNVEQIARQFSPHILGGGGLGSEIQRVMGMPLRDPQGAMEALLATHPLTAGQVEPAQDVIGRPRKSGGLGLGSALVRGNVENDASVIRAFRSAGEGLPTPPKQVRDESTQTVKTLSPAQQKRWQRAFGSALTENWNGYGNPRDKDTLQKVESESRKVANETILGQR